MSTAADAAPAPQDVPYLDIFDPKFDFASPEVAAARERSWYAESPMGIFILRHREAQELLRDERMAHAGKAYMEMNGIVDGPIYDWFVPMIGNREGADHRRLRGLINKTFTQRRINGLRPFIRAQAEQLAEQLGSVEVCDFVEDFANPLPLAVMAKLLGVPPEDYDIFRVWTTEIGMVFSLGYGGDIQARVAAAVTGLNGYVESLMKDKLAAPGDDLSSALVAAQQTDGVVSHDELVNLLVTLVFAAHDTTRHQLANAMVTFADHPKQWTILAAQPELAPQAVEEVMRWFPSADGINRIAAEDFDYQGLHLTKGTEIRVCVQSAQRDPRAFNDADSFDITIPKPVSPVQFGGGTHFCLGAALARTELGEALPALTARLGPPIIAGPVSWRFPIGIYGPNELPLRFG